MILCRPRRDRIRLIDGVNADRCRFVRVLWKFISNESILVLKENKHNFYSFQHIFIQHNSNYFNFLTNLSTKQSFIIVLLVKAHTRYSKSVEWLRYSESAEKLRYCAPAE